MYRLIFKGGGGFIWVLKAGSQILFIAYNLFNSFPNSKPSIKTLKRYPETTRKQDNVLKFSLRENKDNFVRPPKLNKGKFPKIIHAWYVLSLMRNIDIIFKNTLSTFFIFSKDLQFL